MDLVSVVARVLGANASKTIVEAAVSYLEQDSNLANTLSALVQNNFSDSAKQLLSWVATKQGETAKSPPALEPIALEKAEEVAAAIEVATSVTGAEIGRLLSSEGEGLALLPPEHRIGFGLSRSGGEFRPVLLLASSEAITAEIDPRVDTRVVGFAAADTPSSGGDNTPPLEDDGASGEHRPGRSVAHHQGLAGSLGLYVTYNSKPLRRTIRGFLGASHVLGNLNRANQGDMILSPGPPPDYYLDTDFFYGRYVKGRILVHHETQNDPRSAVNRCDVALAELSDSTIPFRNVVPDPNDPSHRYLPIADVVPLNKISDYLEGDVFLVGRTTPFSKGTLVVSSVREFPIRMPNWRNYLFGNLCVVERQGQIPFSRPGDSGALVYVLDGKYCYALGFVIGGNDTYSFFTPAAICMEAMKVKLYETPYGR